MSMPAPVNESSQSRSDWWKTGEVVMSVPACDVGANESTRAVRAGVTGGRLRVVAMSMPAPVNESSQSRSDWWKTGEVVMSVPACDVGANESTRAVRAGVTGGRLRMVAMSMPAPVNESSQSRSDWWKTGEVVMSVPASKYHLPRKRFEA